MKHFSMIFAILVSSLSLNAMAPDVTKWQEICKDSEKKQELATVYKNFWKKRFETEVVLTVGSWSSFGLLIACGRKIPEMAVGAAILSGPLVVFALCRTACLSHTTDRYHLAKQGNLSYLNHDVLEQLGNPRVYEGSSQFTVEDFEKSNSYSKHGSGYSRDYISTTKLLYVDNIEGIKEALSGKKVKE